VTTFQWKISDEPTSDMWCVYQKHCERCARSNVIVAPALNFLSLLRYTRQSYSTNQTLPTLRPSSPLSRN